MGRIRSRVVVVASAVLVVGIALAIEAIPRRPPAASGNGRPAVEVPASWRTEVWHGAQVSVPADWGWGAAPIRERGDAFLCGGPGALVSADGERATTDVSERPWVGRPVYLSDLCQGGDVLDAPRTDYVWLGTDLPAGAVDLGDGFTRETVQVAGTTVTVGSADDRLRAQVLASVRHEDACPPSLDTSPTVTSVLTEGMGPVESAAVCAYQRLGLDDTHDGRLSLVYATSLTAAAAQEYHDAIYAGQAGLGDATCPDEDEYVVITLHGQDREGSVPVEQETVVRPGCDQVETVPGVVVPLTAAGRAPWSRNGLQAVLRAFIGMLG